MELSFVAVFILVPLSILAVEENNVMYADAMQSYSAPETQDTYVDKQDYAFLKLVHQKIDQHTEALEKLKKIIDANENLSKKILEKLSHNHTLEKAETHGKIQILRTNNLRVGKNTCQDDTPIVKKLSYGMMLRTVLLTSLSKACRECEMEGAVDMTTTTRKTTTKTTTKRWIDRETRSFLDYLD